MLGTRPKSATPVDPLAPGPSDRVRPRVFVAVAVVGGVDLVAHGVLSV